MNAHDSLTLMQSINNRAFENPEIEQLLCRHFQEVSDVIWKDALKHHELL